MTDAEAETPILWPPDVKNWLIRKDRDAGKDWRQEAKGTIEDKTVGRHHQLNGYEFKQAPGVGDGQGGLVCCSPWGHKELDTTEQLNWRKLRNRGYEVAGKLMKQNWNLGNLTLEPILLTVMSNCVMYKALEQCLTQDRYLVISSYSQGLGNRFLTQRLLG